MTNEELNIHIAELLGNAYDHKTGKVDMEYLDAGIRAVVRKAEVSGAEELFQMIDEEYGSFHIDEAIGRVLQKYRKSIRKA